MTADIAAIQALMSERRAKGLQEAVYYCYGSAVEGDLVEFGTIFDDYGHFIGARKAVDEFRSERGRTAPLLRVDYSCRLMMKLAGT